MEKKSVMGKNEGKSKVMEIKVGMKKKQIIDRVKNVVFFYI